MSTASRLSVLAFASTVLASPFAGHGHGHGHAHRHLHTGSSGAPYHYSGANSTGLYGTIGTGPASYASPTVYGGETTLTNTVTGKTTMYTTIYETVHLSAATSGAQISAADVSGECGADVTVTSTEKVYVTVTAGQVSSSSAPAAVPYGSSSSVASPIQSSSSAASVPAYSAPAYSAPSSSSSSSEAAPVSTSSYSASAPAYSAPAYTPSSVSSSVAAPVTTSSSVAPTSSAPAYTPSTASSSSSSIVAVLPSTYSVADKGSDSTATSSAPASYSSSASSSSGKRGLAYNDASLTDCFSGSSQVSWAYNWISSSGGLTGYDYIPTLHSTSEDFLGSWITDVETALSGGSTTLFSFNEPDIASQANMDVATAVQAYKDNMGKFAGKAKVCAPSVSNSGDPNQGLGYLQKFLDQCTGDDCPIDCLNVHWYATCDAENFKTHIDSAVSMLTDNQTLYVSEFGVTDGSDDDIASFLEEVMAYMDSNDKVSGYAYYMVSDGLLVSGSEPSSYGSTYKSYTS